MKTFKTILIYFLSAFVILSLLLYLVLIFIVPEYLEDNICSVTGICTETENLKIEITPALRVKLDADIVKSGDSIYVEKIHASADIKKLAVQSINADYIFIDGNKFAHKKSSNSSFNLNKIPEINIKRLEYISKGINLNIQDISYDGHLAKFKGEAKTKFLQNKFLGTLENTGSSVFAQSIKFGSALSITGKLTDKKGNYDFHVTGRNLSVNQIEKALLVYQKSQDPAKKFIENFVNYAGRIDVDLNFKNSGVYGICTAKKLSANAVWFNIPLYFEKAVFNFKGKTVTSDADGLLGGEKVNHILNITHLGTSEKEVYGELNTTLQGNFKYIPDLTILNSADAKIVYKIKHKKIDVMYLLKLKEGSDLLYKKAYLGLRDKQRRFLLKTYKDGNKLYITNYDYSLIQNDSIKNVLTGNGLLIKQNDHMKPQFLTCKTNGFAPVSVTGSFGEYVEGGEFNGDLKYDFVKNQIFGKFELINTRFKNFFVSRAKIISEKEKIYIKADGTYESENFFCDIDASNKFSKNIIIYKMNMFLNELIIRKSQNFSSGHTDIASKIKDNDINIENWEVRIGKIKKDRIVIKNIELNGSLKDDTFRFSMPELKFANGTLTASGRYNFADASSCIDFAAKNIDSNTAAEMLFNLPEQVNGTADAILHLNTAKNLQEIKACACFQIKEGFLPQLGSTEFMLKNSKKIKIADLTNADLTSKKALQSNIKGSFYVDNSKLKDINLTSQQKFLSLFIEGDYDIEQEFADLSLYGKYNKEAPKGIKILFIPLNWILNIVFRPESTMDLYKDKLDKIPSIESDASKNAYFRVKLSGDLNNGNIDVELKGIK